MPPKPAIFLPGFPSSELLDPAGNVVYPPPSPLSLLNAANKAAYLARLSDVPGDLVAGSPVPSLFGLVPEAQSLYDILATFGYDITPASTNFKPIGWDWRLGVGAAATVNRIRATLDALSPNKDGKVIAILHSTGGLVFRAFLEQEPAYAKCFEQVLTFGIPWAGTLEALHAVVVGVGVGIGPIKLVSEAEGASIFGHAQAAYDLFPTDPLLNLFISTGVSTTPKADQSWTTEQYQRDLLATAHGPFPQQFNDLPLTNVCGWGGATWPVVTLVGGKITWLAPNKEAGDGTVPFVSSSWLQGAKVRPVYVPIGAFAEGAIPKIHGQLWGSVAIQQIFREVLGGAAPQPFITAAADSDQSIDFNSNVNVRMTALAADGSALPNCVATVDISGKKTKVPFDPTAMLHGDRRAEVLIKRAGIKHNVANDLFRFEITFTWDGGVPVVVPVLIHSV
jgi:pimeloyl-ACP methyl ester carboxylesterase